MFLYRKVFTIAFALLFFLAPGKSQAFDLGVIEPGGLSQTLSTWTLLDARPKKEWRAGHIPGAVSFSWEENTRTDENGIPYRTLPPRQLAEALGKFGIDENTSVVVYGDADTSWGGEGWACWVLSWLGHKGPVRLLNGGIQDWSGHGLSINTGEENFNKTTAVYHYHVQPLVDITADKIRSDPLAYQLVDTRSMLEWIKGRIPGAAHISWEKFFTGMNRYPISCSELRSLLARHDINPDRTVVYYCTGGIRSGYAWLVHTLAGLSSPVNFEGGVEEWNKLLQTK